MIQHANVNQRQRSLERLRQRLVGTATGSVTPALPLRI